MARNEELQTLEENGTWVIIDLPEGKNAIGCTPQNLVHKEIVQDTNPD